jgi:hypothetical protein
LIAIFFSNVDIIRASTWSKTWHVLGAAGEVTRVGYGGTGVILRYAVSWKHQSLFVVIEELNKTCDFISLVSLKTVTTVTITAVIVA